MLLNINWSQIRSIKGANIYGLRGTPDGFVDWAVKHGAVQMQSDGEWETSRPNR
jgi:hypothetical protein